MRADHGYDVPWPVMEVWLVRDFIGAFCEREVCLQVDLLVTPGEIGLWCCSRYRCHDGGCDRLDGRCRCFCYWRRHSDVYVVLGLLENFGVQYPGVYGAARMDRSGKLSRRCPVHRRNSGLINSLSELNAGSWRQLTATNWASALNVISPELIILRSNMNCQRK